VQGLDPRRITATINCGYPCKNTFARVAAIKGAINQLEINVNTIGQGRSRNFFISPKLRFNKAGYIMRNKAMPIGIEIPANDNESITGLIHGNTWEMSIPIIIHKATQSAKYFSNILNPFSLVVHSSGEFDELTSLHANSQFL
jgi:hypothetical protein